jgi:hypothetical protein
VGFQTSTKWRWWVSRRAGMMPSSEGAGSVRVCPQRIRLPLGSVSVEHHGVRENGTRCADGIISADGRERVFSQRAPRALSAIAYLSADNV